MGTNVHPAQILIVLAAVAVAAEATWRVLRRRTDARQRATLLAAAHAARRDPLTGSGSRFAFHETMATAVSRRRRAAVVLVDLDGSRPSVSRFGDRALDELLVLIAGRVQHLAAAAGGSSFRLRRDELAAIVNGPVTDATGLAAQLLAAVAKPTEINLIGHPLTVTVSACAALPPSPRTARTTRGWPSYGPTSRCARPSRPAAVRLSRRRPTTGRGPAAEQHPDSAAPGGALQLPAERTPPGVRGWCTTSGW